MAMLLHLNGPPGIGKSTIARRYVIEHPGTLNCDIDVLRTLVGGWSEDFAVAGAMIRPAALAMIEAHLATGQDVVLPQLLVDSAELALFEARATRTGTRFVERYLVDDVDRAVARFERRGESGYSEPWHDQVRDIIAAKGGVAALVHSHAAVMRLMEQRPAAVVVPTVEGDVQGTYRQLLHTLE